MPDKTQPRTAVILAGALFLLILGVGAALMITAPGRLETQLGADPAGANEPTQIAKRDSSDSQKTEEEPPSMPVKIGKAEEQAEGQGDELARGDPAAPALSAPKESESTDEAEEKRDPRLPEPGTVALTRPDMETVYDHITKGDPREMWPLFPGLKPQFSGHHGQVLSLRVNLSTEQALNAAERVPHGGFLVLDVLDGLGKPIETYVMSRWDGIDPKNEDWLYARFGREGRAIRFGKVVPCIDCHMKEPSSGGILMPPGPPDAAPDEIEEQEQPEAPEETAPKAL
jgi:hypothetical protein